MSKLLLFSFLIFFVKVSNAQSKHEGYLVLISDINAAFYSHQIEYFYINDSIMKGWTNFDFKRGVTLKDNYTANLVSYKIMNNDGLRVINSVLDGYNCCKNGSSRKYSKQDSITLQRNGVISDQLLSYYLDAGKEGYDQIIKVKKNKFGLVFLRIQGTICVCHAFDDPRALYPKVGYIKSDASFTKLSVEEKKRLCKIFKDE